MANLGKFLRRVGADIAHGENLDAYATVVIALVLATLNILGKAGSQSIAGITLAVLTLITVSLLVNRHRVEDLGGKISPSIASVFLEKFPETVMNEEMENSSEIWLMGASLGGVANEHYLMFERKLNQGHKIRVLVTNPDNEEILKISEMRAYSNPRIRRAQAEINSTISDFCELRKLAPDRLFIRTIDYPMPYRMFLLNPESLLGKMYISNYPFQTSDASVPKFIISAKEKRWFELYKQEANKLWEAGKDWANSLQE